MTSLMSEFTQHHHWGIIEHGIRVEIWNQYVADEFLWEFTSPEDVLAQTFGLTAVNDFLARGGGFELVDRPKPLPRFHDVTLWAYHADPRMLTWISLQKR
jgi:hypothetical protein